MKDKQEEQLQKIGERVSQYMFWNLHLAGNMEQSKIVRVESVQWSNTCLDVPYLDEVCTTILKPGYRVKLDVAGQQYEYHTDKTGQQIRISLAPEPKLGKIIVEVGMPKGSCASLEIGTRAVAFGSCSGLMLQGGYYEDMDQSQLLEFRAKYAPFEVNRIDQFLKFSGEGHVIATPAEQRMIGDWAGLVKMKAQADRSGAGWPVIMFWSRGDAFKDSWHDELTIVIPGIIRAASYQIGSSETSRQRYLTPVELTQLYAWQDAYHSFSFEQIDSPTITNTIKSSLSMRGAGATVPTDEQKQVVNKFVEQLFTALAKEQ